MTPVPSTSNPARWIGSAVFVIPNIPEKGLYARPMIYSSGRVPIFIALLSLLGGGSVAFSQDMEPRRWTQLPVGTNVLGTGYSYTTGELSLDPILQISEADVTMQTYVGSYNDYVALAGQTARIDVQVPHQSGVWEGLVAGTPVEVSRDGFADPRIRFSVNLAGAPAGSAEEFLEYRKEHIINTTVGAAIAVQVPLGEYMEDRLINLGQNRFVFTPQLGVLHTRGPWSFELTTSAFIYTENDDFFGGNRLEQDPLYAVQGHIVRTLPMGFWISAGVAYDWAGRSTINGAEADDEKSDLLYGGSFGFPLGRAAGMRIGYIGGRSYTDTGIDSNTIFVSLSVRF